MPPAGTYEYRVEMRGKEVGHYKFEVSHEGTRTRVEVEGTIKVKFLFVTVYRMDHQRVEIWENGKCVSLQGNSDYHDGFYELSLEKRDNKLIWRVNDESRTIRETVVTFIPWKVADFDRATFLTANGKAHTVTNRRGGLKPVEINGKTTELRHFRLAGDRERDLYYNSSGILEVLRFEKNGRKIEILRTDDGRKIQ